MCIPSSCLQPLVERIWQQVVELATNYSGVRLLKRKLSVSPSSGGKVRKFLPILEAAAGGKLDSKWYHRRSLETVDFRSCLALTDVDVNALCVLHSRVESLLHSCAKLFLITLIYWQLGLSMSNTFIELPCTLPLLGHFPFVVLA